MFRLGSLKLLGAGLQTASRDMFALRTQPSRRLPEIFCSLMTKIGPTIAQSADIERHLMVDLENKSNLYSVYTYFMDISETNILGEFL